MTRKLNYFPSIWVGGKRETAKHYLEHKQGAFGKKIGKENNKQKI